MPSPDAAAIQAWAAEICDANADFADGSVQVSTDFPEPAERTLESVQQVHAARRPGTEANLSAALDRLRDVAPLPGGQAFVDALQAELEGTIDTLPSFYDSIASATSLDEADQGLNDYGMAASQRLLDSARAVAEIDIVYADAVAAVSTGCRFFEFDARSRPHGLDTGIFSETVLDDSFEQPGDFRLGPFEGGEVGIADGALTMSFTGTGSKAVLTDQHDPSSFHDVRVEATFTSSGSALAGLSCRDDGENRYFVVVNPLGLILIYKSGDSPLLGRRAAPEGFDPLAAINLAIECVAGNLDPVLIAVYLDGERVAEVVDEDTLASEGFVGMYTQSLAPGATAAFQNIKILGPAD